MNKMDLWTDLNSGADWGLDLFSPANGLFGDLKDVSHLKGDSDPACKPGDAVEQMASPESEEPLDYWMESGDLGSFLDALDNGQDRLSAQDSFLDCSQETDVKDSISVASGQTILFSYVNGGDAFNHGLTPPDSPEQVTPIIKLEPEISVKPEINEHLWVLETQYIQEPVPSQSYTIEEFDTISEPSPVVIQAPIDLLDDQYDLQSSLCDTDIFDLSLVPDLGTSSELVDSKDGDDINYSCSSDEGSSILSPSTSPSPRPSIDSLIQSSPELYKVIATPSARFSPYSKSKGEQKIKDGSNSKPKVEKQVSEDVSEEFFPSNLGKKERKKLQNKNAAIRYRQKKKAEVKCITSEVQELEDKNHDLKTKVDDLQREVKYMKSLMEDIYKAKGLVK